MFEGTKIKLFAMVNVLADSPTVLHGLILLRGLGLENSDLSLNTSQCDHFQVFEYSWRVLYVLTLLSNISLICNFCLSSRFSNFTSTIPSSSVQATSFHANFGKSGIIECKFSAKNIAPYWNGSRWETKFGLTKKHVCTTLKHAAHRCNNRNNQFTSKTHVKP